MFDILNYSFMVRGLEAGVIIALIAPLIGVFLVLKRYSLIADTLSHVSLAGVALGLLFGVNPVWTAIVISILASLGIERLRSSRKVLGESALAIFLSGSLALALVLFGLGKGLGSGIFAYLFGSIVTVTTTDVYTIAILGVVVLVTVFLFFKELIFVSFDEEAGKASGIPVKLINTILIVLSALVISFSIPVIGVLLVSALIVLPVSTALLLRLGFGKTIIASEIVSVFSVVAGVICSFYLNLPSSGVIVLLMLAIFFFVYWFRPKL